MLDPCSRYWDHHNFTISGSYSFGSKSFVNQEKIKNLEKRKNRDF